MKKYHAESSGIGLKKRYGQHFLRDHSVVDHMIDHVQLTNQTSIFEIGCGDGFLTEAILQQPCERLWVFEIDQEWAQHVREKFPDARLTVFEENFLDLDFGRLKPHAPWTVLANLPYQVSFPILYLFCKHVDLLREGVVMIQEEVAQKVVKTSGRGYGFPALFLQHHFEWKLLKKVLPGAFLPPPKVDSRLIYFKARPVIAPIPEEEEFWKFIKLCFRQPRRTLRNNLAQSHYPLEKFPIEILELRSQQLGMPEFLQLWDLIRS